MITLHCIQDTASEHLNRANYNRIMLLLLAVTVAVLAAFKLYKWATSTKDYFEKQGVKHNKLNLFTDMVNAFTYKSPNILFKKFYDRFPNER